MIALPEWIKAISKKAYHHQNGAEIFRDFEKTYEALTIAWEALDSIKCNKRDQSVYSECEDVMRRIAEMGKE